MTERVHDGLLSVSRRPSRCIASISRRRWNTPLTLERKGRARTRVPEARCTHQFCSDLPLTFGRMLSKSEDNCLSDTSARREVRVHYVAATIMLPPLNRCSNILSPMACPTH
ncbi:hypothetical protein AVEN_187900-1 [Araneus ventricosus]|uniref:Uncharacterized protein n=1 Tax=Araneus ventricosus TaxID=182803 RepID=A0A4Y2CVR1_ARAVE|nr:hypothetical protein AVEN_187900-1 [Araneus ventricosus]